MTTSSADSSRYLATYLQDHRAGARAGVQLAERMAHEHDGTPLGDLAGTLAIEIDQDRQTLDHMAERAGFAQSPLKQALARAAELAGRLKLNGRILRRSPLTPLVEIEGLLGGIDLKRALWWSLSESAALAPPEGGFEALIHRATDQRRRLVVEHERAARGAFEPQDS